MNGETLSGFNLHTLDRPYQSPSNFNATDGTANEWNENSAGYLNPWTWVTNTYGARPASY